MSVEPFSPDETAQVEAIEGSPPPAADEQDRPSAPGDTPEGLGDRPAAPFTSEVKRPVQGVADALGNTGFDESDKSDPAHRP
ncbi:MAG: hypothetical protein JWN20_1900 [Jatrophihabitantaceae bacterium]|nr:hypothetical protein [Jatrophihabitantaceae bacterium]